MEKEKLRSLSINVIKIEFPKENAEYSFDKFSVVVRWLRWHFRWLLGGIGVTLRNKEE